MRVARQGRFVPWGRIALRFDGRLRCRLSVGSWVTNMEIEPLIDELKSDWSAGTREVIELGARRWSLAPGAGRPTLRTSSGRASSASAGRWWTPARPSPRSSTW